MKTFLKWFVIWILVFVALVIFVDHACAGTNGTPLLRPFLQTDFDGNGKSGTNFNNLTTTNLNATNIHAGTVASTNFSGYGFNITGLNPTNLASPIPTNKVPGYLAAWATNDPATFAGGGGSSQTPWTTNIDASTFGLYNLGNIQVGVHGRELFDDLSTTYKIKSIFLNDDAAPAVGLNEIFLAYFGIDTTNGSHGYTFSYNTQFDAAGIQASILGVVGKPLALNPYGGGIRVGTFDDGSGAALQVKGDAHIAGDLSLTTEQLPCDGTIYNDGTTTVTGDGSCAFETEVHVGDIIVESDGARATVVSITDDNELTTDVPLTADSGDPQSFSVVHNNLSISSGVAKFYNGQATVLGGLPAETVFVHTTNTAALSTALIAPEVSGYFRVSYNAKISRAATTSSTLGPFQLGYLDADAVSDTVNINDGKTTTANTASCGSCTNSISGVFLVHPKAGHALSASLGYTSSGATSMQYVVSIIVEKL